jgi:hypothetical protein
MARGVLDGDSQEAGAEGSHDYFAIDDKKAECNFLNPLVDEKNENEFSN